MIEQALKDRIKDALDIAEVIGRFVTLKRAGKHYVGICPFHTDNHPSLTVVPAKQSYKCHACGAGGDVFEFIKEHEKLSFPEAVKFCASLAGIPFEDKDATPEDVAREKDRESLRIAMQASSMFFEKNLDKAEQFLHKRGYSVDDATLKDFRIGYAPAGSVLLKNLTASGYKIEYLQRINVIAEGEHGNFYDVFRDRVMFPFMDLNGNVIGFSGRIVTANDKTGKYVNTGNTELFKKGNAIFGLYQAKKAISDKDRVYLVEGQFDVTSMHTSGVKNTIAGSGTALTPAQIKLIKRFTSNVTTLYDGDKAGVKAAYTHCEELLKEGMNVKCISLPDGMDPDNIAMTYKEETSKWLLNNTTDFVTYFYNTLDINPEDPESVEKGFTAICKLVAVVKEDSLRNEYIKAVALKFHGGDVSIAKKKIRSIRLKADGKNEEEETLKPGIYGMDELKDYLKDRHEASIPILTADYQEYLELYYDEPVIFLHGRSSMNDVQTLRSICSSFVTSSEGLDLDGVNESEYLAAIAELYRSGITDIKVQCEDEDDPDRVEETSFLDYYITLHSTAIDYHKIDRPYLTDRCAEMISYASETVRNVSSKNYSGLLKLNQKQYTDILKPYLDKRKSRAAINSQREDDEEYYDPDVIPDYVEDNPEYKEMYNNYGYYPRVNKQKEPIGYMFRSDKGGHTLVADFYMEPLLHIKDPEPENNKRIFKVYRRYYRTPLYMAFKSTSLLKKSSFEEVLILEEALNFDNGEEKHWAKIRSCMSRKYTTCRELKIYGQQSEDFYAFANGIFHIKDGVPVFEKSSDLGVVTHNEENYYLPAFSTIYANTPRDDDKYETLRYFVYKDIPVAQQCTFERWANLMNEVYKVNDNGKWALIYAIMCAFRSDIHSIDRLFTAPFFMGPTSSGKTQIAISIRSLFLSPDMPAFNLNTGSDAAFSTLMGSYRDVPVVLEEYNNKDISDVKFQALKAITYDGDGRQKRKGTSGRDIEIDKVFTPVAISGQETPQRDDNALMNRIIVCEVPKKEVWTDDETEVFQALKQAEKNGLSNVLFEILKLRPVIRENFKRLQRCIAKDLTAKVQAGASASGDMVRIINTTSLFLTTCKIMQDFAPALKLPFTYDEFFNIAAKKVIFQVELISHTDKLANFFKAMDVMITSGTLKIGRDFMIDTPERGKLTIKDAGGEKREVSVPNSKILFLRLSNIFTQYARSSFNEEKSTQSTIEQNLRSNPSYVGFVPSKRFKWEVVNEVPRHAEETTDENGNKIKADDTMIRVVKTESQISSCIALNYDQFKRFYDIDLERNKQDQKATEDGEQGLDAEEFSLN